MTQVEEEVAQLGREPATDDGEVAQVDGEMTRAARGPDAAAVSWDVARALAHTAVAPLAPRRLPLEEAVGCVLATPLVAPTAVPPVDRSAMDGYAVRGSGPWRIVGAVLAGSALPAPLEEGQACTIVTGASIPPGTTTVLPDEQATRLADEVAGPAELGRHIRRAGEECAAGETLLPAGTLVLPQLLGLAATLGLNQLSVIPKPRVVALITGDELVHQGPSAPGRVRDAIGPMLPALITRAGATFGAVPRTGAASGCTPSLSSAVVHLPDSRDGLLAAIAGAEAEIILVSGSSAAGPADHLRGALAELGAELIVNGVACRPGHPQALARLADGRLVAGLPGNPLAALTAFLTLGVAAVRRLRGEGLDALAVASVPGGLACHPRSTRLVPVRVTTQGAVPVGHGGSAMLRGAAAADALAVIEPGPGAAIAARLLPLDPGVRPWVV
ncbi:molybdopterin molybdotransferase MoeA [Kribbella sp. CA-293567]|uniref:molybdopterin molybdotransferase MoeA n=1 Tax=Kribbella sp. CA-293567 TaxID=3002436 RepID=UPI0022DD9481|nr:molybdopterin molybdotransferase MoeA [Kribbella sp. CA-293567]WBQ04763.1 molybdopterin molybdotransferase MoeA [Kribbella sp. CA-293567]